MNKLTLSIILTLTSFATNGQCNVRKDLVGDGLYLYKNSKERIYQNDDLENGIQSVFISIICVKGSNELLPQDHKLLFDWWIIIDSGAANGKPRVTPRSVIIQWTDKSQSELKASYLENPRTVSAVNMQESHIKITSDLFDKIRTGYLQKIIVKDNKENTEINCLLRNDLMTRQANCIADAVGY